MEGLKFATSAQLVAEEIDEDGHQWIEVMPTATEARNGPWFFTITAEDLEVFAEHIRANPDRIPVDYDHDTSKGGKSEAAGWFTGQAEVRDTDNGPRLMAEVAWTSKAREEILDKRYRFISPEWDMKERDKKTGLLSKAKELLAATLTNRPFFTELAPVASEDTDDPAASEAEEEDNMDELRAALGLPEDATDEQILEAVTAAKTKADEASKRRQPRQKGDTVNAAIAQALGLPADADEATVIAAAQRAAEDADRVEAITSEFGALSAQAARAKSLEDRIKVLEAESNRDKVDFILAEGVRRGKVAPAEKGALAKLFAAKPDDLEELIDARPDNMFRLVPAGFGGDVEAGEDIVSIAEEFSSTEADGVDPESARLHVAAMKHLKAEGIARPTADQYADALEHVAAVLH